jgi:hypothetical protein
MDSTFGTMVVFLCQVVDTTKSGSVKLADPALRPSQMMPSLSF